MADKGIRLYDKDQIQMYVFGGKGGFLLRSVNTGKEYEYKINPMSVYNPNFSEYVFYISQKTEHGSEFLGVLKIDENKYIHSKKSNVMYNSEVIKGILWLLKQFEIDDEFPVTMEFYHMGICSCCGKRLTTPLSIEIGIGPICFERYGNERLKKLINLKNRIKAKLDKTNA